MAAETVWRSKALSADVNTPFNSAPLPGSSNSNVSEFNASGRQSRISMLVEGKLSDVKIGGYYEGDFLGGGSTSNNNQSNSYVFRQRQFWAQAAFDNGFKVTGGQMWSLITETTKGLDNRTENLPNTIDAQYHIGFSWARQYGLRFTKDFGDKFWVGFAVEDPQTTFTVHGNPTTTIVTGGTTVLLPTRLARRLLALWLWAARRLLTRTSSLERLARAAVSTIHSPTIHIIRLPTWCSRQPWNLRLVGATTRFSAS